jgi:hypothetical protein
MKSTLGATTVQTIAESAALAASKKIFGAGAIDESWSSAGGVHTSTSALPPVAPNSTRASVDFGSRGGLRRGSIPDHMEEVDVMLADRGTQTVEHATCQTDPDPRVLQCTMCYEDYYGHTPDGVGCPHGGGGTQVGCSGGGVGGGVAMYGSDPVFAALVDRYHQTPFAALLGRGYQAPTEGGGGRGRQPTAGGLANAITSTALLREQLSCVQSTIDMLISRYNLPPPPGLEHLAI